MAVIETWFNQVMTQPVKVRYIDGNVFSQDNNGNLIGVNVLEEDGTPASLSGSVSASVIRADGATVSVIGSLSGNQCSVVLPQACYTIPGVVSIVIKLTSGTTVTTVGAVVGNVYQSTTDTVVDPGTIIPSVETLIAQIQAAVASIPADYSSLWTSLAPAFSTSTAYAVGQYVTYNGGLYRFISAHAAGTWNSAHVVSVNLGDDISALKSAISEEVESAILTSGISDTYHGVTFELSAPDTLKVYGTATATRRVLCLNGQNKEATSSTAFEKTLEKGVYNIETEITGALTENVAWAYTYTTFANMQISVTKNAPVGTFTFENPVMFGFSFSTGTNFGTSENPTYIKISAKKIVGNDEIARAGIESIGENAVIMRGRVTDFGTSFGSCTAPGAYSFTASDLATITDEPDGFNAGGLLITYVNGTRVWQEIKSTFEGFIRYGYTGAWKRQPETLLVTYTSGSGDDSSDAQITIDIPKGVAGRNIRWKMGHCVDADSNADVWRLMYMYYVLSNGTATQMNRHGEFECALHLNGRDDFSGGITHGDEVDQNVTFLMDGQPVTASNANGFCKEFRIIRNSILYDPADHTTAIANHGCEYIFTNEGLTINQSIKWLVAETLTNCFLAMLPIYKTFSTYRYDDVSFVVTENTGSSYSVTVPGATSVTEYNADVSTTMEVPKYPTGLTGGDCALITDNNGNSYNKVYFVVCTGGNSSINELWKSKTVFKCA